MNIYSVYSDSSKKTDNLVFVKEGFSFFAMIFNGIWALYHKMWFIAIATFAMDILVRNYTNSYIAYSANIAILFLFGTFASEIRAYHIMKNNHELYDIILASNEEEAEVKYYERVIANKITS